MPSTLADERLHPKVANWNYRPNPDAHDSSSIARNQTLTISRKRFQNHCLANLMKRGWQSVRRLPSKLPMSIWPTLGAASHATTMLHHDQTPHAS